MFKKIVLFIIVLGILAFFIAGSPFYFDDEKKIEFYVDNPLKLHQLSKTLKKENIIRSASFFRFLLRNSKIDRKTPLGYYQFSNHESVFSMLLKLKKGEVEQTRLTIVEGYDLYDIANLLVQKKVIANQEIFIKTASNSLSSDYIKKEFNIETKSLEGFLYPDTYQIPKGASYKLFIKAASQEFKKRIFTKYRYLSPKEFYRALITASLIQKETSLGEEMPLVSSVIHNRIQKGMKLQIDPTVIYTIKIMGLVDESLKEGKINIQRHHFQIASPYNTYYSNTIPPGPIANPSEQAFTAAVNPSKTTYLYFVANPETGRHTFTSNLKDHNLYVERYTQKKRDMKTSE